MTERTVITGVLVVGAVLALTAGGCKGIVDPQAEAVLMTSLGSTAFTVFPAFIRDAEEVRYDAEAAGAIGAFFAEDDLAEVTVSDVEVPITGPWHSNQAKMLQESAAAFASYVEENPIETDYALLPEYIFLGGGGGVGGIHCYILDAERRVAFAVLLNSHHQEFADANPQTVDDCTQVLIGVLRDRLVPSD